MEAYVAEHCGHTAVFLFSILIEMRLYAHHYIVIIHVKGA